MKKSPSNQIKRLQKIQILQTQNLTLKIQTPFPPPKPLKTPLQTPLQTSHPLQIPQIPKTPTKPPKNLSQPPKSSAPKTTKSLNSEEISKLGVHQGKAYCSWVMKYSLS
mmetsp:Transcript_29716/g.29304  ORF Transcript_29716/g.29304 Transcript_29716/m.29304 type:complete len:109 (-) Transcript_29716:16-342(-)